MLTKIDKLILLKFIKPFLLYFAVVLFVFLSQFLLTNFKYFVGKDLGWDVFSELFFYFSLVLVPRVLPLSVMLAALVSYGSLGEYSELTAIKSAGISLLRLLRPALVVTVVVTGFSIYYNDAVIPYANLKAYSLLYDVKQKKPTMDLREGEFYNGFDNYSIKVERKGRDGQSLEGVMIYNHNRGYGNTEVIMAEFGRMYQVRDGDFLELQLKNGTAFAEVYGTNSTTPDYQFVRNQFDSATILFSMASFDMNETRKELFKGHNLMKTFQELQAERDSLSQLISRYDSSFEDNVKAQYYYLFDTLPLPEAVVAQIAGTGYNESEQTRNYRIALNAFNRSKAIYNIVSTHSVRELLQKKQLATYQIDLQKKVATAVTILLMFLIGAPLGAIIKKGGIAIPVVIAVAFYILYYIININTEKYARELMLEPLSSTWYANIIMLMIAIFSLVQARYDVRLFDSDHYHILSAKISQFFNKIS